jgi:hypothetical protein
MEDQIAEARARLDPMLSPENKALLAYLELLDRRRGEENEEVIQAYNTGVGFFRILRWATTVLAAVAAIWAGFHAHIIVQR